jgi:hypothetical protein
VLDIGMGGGEAERSESGKRKSVQATHGVSPSERMPTDDPSPSTAPRQRHAGAGQGDALHAGGAAARWNCRPHFFWMLACSIASMLTSLASAAAKIGEASSARPARANHERAPEGDF